MLESNHRTRKLQWIEFSFAVLAAWLFFGPYQSIAPAHHDSVRDFLVARDCFELDRCVTAGASAAVRGFYQGAVWTDVLAIMGKVGLGPLAVAAVVRFSFALAGGLLFAAIAAWLGRGTATIATVVFCSCLALIDAFGVLWNHSLAPIASVCAFVSLACLARSGRTIAAASAAVWVALGFATHLAGVIQYAPLGCLVVLSSVAPWRAAAAAVVLSGAVLGLTSLEMLRATQAALVGEFGWNVILASLGALVVACGFVRRQFLRLSRTARTVSVA